MRNLIQVEVCLGKVNIQVVLAEMTEVVLGQDKAQEPVLIQNELDALSVGNMIISLKTVHIHKQKKNQNECNKCIIWMIKHH